MPTTATAIPAVVAVAFVVAAAAATVDEDRKRPAAKESTGRDLEGAGRQGCDGAKWATANWACTRKD